jgi:hypothetical protein
VIKSISVIIRGIEETLSVEYRENISPSESGFDVLNVPFPVDKCIGYPVLHAYFEHMQLTGYKRYCGYIQLVQRTEIINGTENAKKLLSLDVCDYFSAIGNPYFPYGYPATLYDAPCSNLGSCDKLIWKAHTYLVDLPTRMNKNKLTYLTGFSWGYIEDISGPLGLLDFEPLSESDWQKHYDFIVGKYPNLVK